MSKAEIMNTVSRSFHKVGFGLKKHSPEILIATGVVGTVVSTVMACRATTKISEILDDTKEKVSQVHEVLESKDVPEEKYSEKDAKKDLAIIYTQSAIKFVKLYGPAVMLGAVSISCIVASHTILKKRNVALAAAYATIDKGFKEYRSRVVERFGKDVDHELRYNIKAKEFEETVIDEKTGKEKTVKNIVHIANPNEYSSYARIYDAGCIGYSKDPETNLDYLRMQQNYADKKLKTQGYLLLNDVYEMLGFQKTKAGFVVGWIYNEKHPVGDNFVDFGIYNVNSEKACDFVNGYERNIVLDFNVDGNIIEKM